jgi:RecA/RadA recombinase
MATKRRRVSEAEESSFLSPVNKLGLLQELEKVVKIQSVTLGNEHRVSTGLLCIDLILGGGISPAMYTVAGPEQSAKTTLAIAMMGSAVNQKVSLPVLWDAENSSGSSMDYVENIFNTMGVKANVETIFGVKQNGKYVTEPLVYYRDEAELNTFYDWLSALLRRLPDKRYEDGRWWYVYEATQENKAKYKAMMDRKLSAANGAIYIEAENGSLQAYVLVDSYPSLLPDSMDEDDPKAGMALQAREFAKHVPRVAGKLRAKRVALVGINQIREKIGFVMGDPRYEPGGNALKFYSSVRMWNTPRALSGVPFHPKGKGMYEPEKSVTVEGGSDMYRYIHVKAIKNKLSVPNRETWLRLWVTDGDGLAQGFDPVWDTFYAMFLTGQVSGKRSAIQLDIHGIGPAKKLLTWEQFKLLVIGDKEQITSICERIGYKPFNLRKGMFNLMRKGVLESLYIENLKTKSDSKKEDDDEDEDGDDEDSDD